MVVTYLFLSKKHFMRVKLPSDTAAVEQLQADGARGPPASDAVFTRKPIVI